MPSDLSVKSVQNSDQFSMNFYEALAELNNAKNIVFSPFSVQACVALIHAGATGEIAEEITTGLKLEANDRNLLSESFKEVLDSYADSKILKIVNKIYLQQEYEVHPEFNKNAVESFHSSSGPINFAESAQAATTINNWVEEMTNSKIKDLIATDSLNAATKLVMVNAIHFNGEWGKAFQKDKTVQREFFINENDSVKVDMMKNKAKYNFRYFEDLECSALEMPYRDSDLCMLVFLPNSRTGLKALEEKLKTANLHDLTQEMRMTKVNVKFPKFQAEFSAELTEQLKKLGIKKMFGTNFEFEKLLAMPKEIHVSKVVHKAFLEVDEKGFEAPVPVGINAMWKQIKPSKVTIFNANKPFIYVIWNKRQIILSGRILNL